MEEEPTPPSAASQVYHTVELLEHILTFLDPTDIVKLNLASRYSRDAIMGSKKISRVLWLEPHAPRKALDLRPSTNRRCRPVVIEHSENLPATAKTMGKLNPIFSRLHSENTPNGQIAGVDFAYKPLLYWPHGDWRSMFVTQPPSDHVHIRYWRGCESSGHELVKIQRPCGVRMGDLRDLLGQAMLEQERYVGLDWFEEESGWFSFEVPDMVLNPNDYTDIREVLQMDNGMDKWEKWIWPFDEFEQVEIDWNIV